jgi:hypothetical protein
VGEHRPFVRSVAFGGAVWRRQHQMNQSIILSEVSPLRG